MNFWGLLVESYGTWLLLQGLVDASKDSDIPKNVPFVFAINNQNIISLLWPPPMLVTPTNTRPSGRWEAVHVALA